ncbi:hypothetical protein [Sphingobacterium faecale]|uniref:Uncharacterized protein n=1 Tax=Sphingobacterium faecale TaxID=2803775 RepID=A0ABS1QXM2_9SPHI|nr:hypothetical protein [Sphingobacterium faecale]MBL1407166.1 hypothetical protein [Sphingobacterium faecale]
MLQFHGDLTKRWSNISQQNTALICCGTSVSSEVCIKDILYNFQDLGKTTQNTDFIHTSALKIKKLHYSLNAALVLHTHLSQSGLSQKLKKLESRLKSIDFSILTFNKTIIGDSKVIEVPALLDLIKQLQPELFTWHYHWNKTGF